LPIGVQFTLARERAARHIALSTSLAHVRRLAPVYRIKLEEMPCPLP